MATGDLSSFAQAMRNYGERVVNNANEIKKKAALAVDAEVVMQTPVDKGRARSNWQASLDVPASGTLDAYVPGDKGSTGGANAEAAMKQAQGVVTTAVPEQAINITNNLPYIGRLNDGWSAQAPAGFVQNAVLAGINAIRGSSILNAETTYWNF